MPEAATPAQSATPCQALLCSFWALGLLPGALLLAAAAGLLLSEPEAGIPGQGEGFRKN